MTRSVHTGALSADATAEGEVAGSELTKRSHRHVALRTAEDEAVTGDPEIALEASVDGETWIEVDTGTGVDVSLEADVPDQYVRASIASAADAGSITLWIAAV